MNRRALAAALAGLVVLGLITTLPPTATGGDPIRGARPGYGPTSIATMPNEAAIGPRLWMPGLDDWYNPQGLAVVGQSILVAAYRSDMPRVYRGPCRVYRIDPASGAETGHFDVPPPCGHAGGLAAAANGKLYIADTHTLFLTDLDPNGLGISGRNQYVASPSGEQFLINELRPGAPSPSVTVLLNWTGALRK